MILLGFEVGSGLPVEIPLGHMAITGQTQWAGKTTALESCAVRSNCASIAFLTKRGEGSFRIAHELPPYYEDHIDWRTVRSISEAINEEKWDKRERRWARSICEAGYWGRVKNRIEWDEPQSLDDVLRNADKILDKLGGVPAEILHDLKTDLKTAIGEIHKLKNYCREPSLRPGLNVVDLEAHPSHMQSLIVRSFIRWVHQHGEKTIIALPEAWKFAPALRRSPVRDAAEEFIRQGAALGNFLWIDSQNISGISAVLLSQIRVWLLGRQRLKSEIEKTLDAIPDNIFPRPRAGDVATLGKGEFFACFDQEMYRVYVWPAWMSSALHAQAIARGEESVESAREIAEEFDQEHAG